MDRLSGEKMIANIDKCLWNEEVERDEKKILVEIIDGGHRLMGH